MFLLCNKASLQPRRPARSVAPRWASPTEFRRGRICCFEAATSCPVRVGPWVMVLIPPLHHSRHSAAGPEPQKWQVPKKRRRRGISKWKSFFNDNILTTSLKLNILFKNYGKITITSRKKRGFRCSSEKGAGFLFFYLF